MGMVTSKDILLRAQKDGYAVSAFNVENMEMVKAVLRAADRLKAPVMLQTTASTLKYADSRMYSAMVRSEAQKYDIPVCLHLDHGSSCALAQDCIEAGYTSVMIDGSKERLEKNIAISKEVADMAHARGIPVEAELGTVGGKEDDVESEGDMYTNVEDAVRFVRETGIDSLAVGIGTAHGFYKGTPVLDKDRLSDIRASVDVPLVLHGASGIPAQDVQDCISRGICKVNFATELRAAYTSAVRKLLEEDASVIDPKKMGQAGMAAVEALVEEKIRMCGGAGRYE